MDSATLVTEAEQRFSQLHNADAAELEPDSDALTRVRKDRLSGHPMMPRMTPDNNW